MLKPRTTIRFSSIGYCALHGIQRFEQVDLARKLVRVAVPAIQVDHDRVRWRKFPGIPHAVVQEVDFARGLAAAVEPGVQPPLPIRVNDRRDHQAIRLDALVDLGNVAANHEPCGSCPRSPALLQFVRTLLPFAQQVPLLCQSLRAGRIHCSQSAI